MSVGILIYKNLVTAREKIREFKLLYTITNILNRKKIHNSIKNDKII